ncbi:Protein of unknown function [Gryllus bimaculatus]|nr:Protein of unknown function [Gryllus bimaculatus]
MENALPGERVKGRAERGPPAAGELPPPSRGEGMVGIRSVLRRLTRVVASAAADAPDGLDDALYADWDMTAGGGESVSSPTAERCGQGNRPTRQRGDWRTRRSAPALNKPARVT